MPPKKLLFGFIVSATSLVLTLGLLEIGVRFYSPAVSTGPPLHVLVDSPVLYSLNPNHPEINSQGMRDDEVTVANPEGTFRVLVLGDSIAYGDGVIRRAAFPDRLEALLKKTRQSAEVINTSVMGYTPYNELQYYLTKGRAFKPDVVLVAFCLNDVVNPRLHWDYTEERISDVPPESIPNHEYDRTHAVPLLQRRREAQARENRVSKLLRQHSRLYQILERRTGRYFRSRPEAVPDIRASIPTHITGEDTLSLEVLADEASPESQWLRSVYDELHGAVQADGARLAILLFPLAYQMDAGYPHIPQNRLMDYCTSRAIPCLDLLPVLRRHSKEQMFLLQRSGYDDVWHLSEQGHALAAEAILEFLQTRGLLDAKQR